ncbi:hypothetical protein RQP46_004080 [Phenoliferia psychrophenolica]
MHGQPVNSVLNGVLPLHAAASSGNDEVVKMLIEHGADVNAPRLPRRYSNDRSRSSGIAVGTAGSTPLHFAAANGHVSIIQLLLSHGASPLLVEKNGLDPEAIALQKGHLAAAELLHAWIEDDADNDGASSSGTSLASSSKRRLHPQRSFDALALKLATHAPSPRHFPHSHSSSSLASSVPPNSSAHYGRRLSTSSHLLDPGSSHRRPSLPSVFEKAAHPVAGLKHVLGLSSLRRGSESQAQNSSGSGSSVASGFWGKAAAEHQAELDASSSGSASPARRSEESARQAPATAPPMQTSFFPGGGGGSDAGGSGLGSTRVARTTSIGSAKSAASASANFYRPRQSSQLSGRPSTTAWAASASAATSTAASSRVFEDDDVDQDDDDDVHGGSNSPNPAVARQPGLAPLYEAKSDVSTSSSALVTTTSEQARRNVKKAERDLLQYKAGGASSTLSLSQQLAAYGQSLSIERKLKAQEADPAGSASSKYVWETLGKDGKRVVEAPSRGSSTLKVPKHSDVPTWLAIPSQDRLVPPSSPSGRRSVSPSHSHTSAPPTPSTRRSKESTSAAPIPSPAPTPSIPATPRASSPTSTASSSARPGVFSYVEVVPPTPVAKARTPTAAPRRSTGKSETTHSQKSSKDQVLLDAAEQARIAAAIPQAKITAPKKKAGFTRRLLGLA